MQRGDLWEIEKRPSCSPSLWGSLVEKCHAALQVATDINSWDRDSGRETMAQFPFTSWMEVELLGIQVANSDSLAILPPTL